jgi:hypothetical protein
MTRFGEYILPSLLLLACSGAETQDVLATNVNGSSSGITSSSSGSGSSSGVSSSSGATSGNPAGCTPEEEPNDNRNQANSLEPGRCGSLGRSDSKEFLTFRLKPTTKEMSLKFGGRVRLKVEVDGRTIDLTPDRAGVVPFIMDATYVIEVTRLADGASDVPWSVEVVEK